MLGPHPAAPKLKRAYADGPQGQVHYYDSQGDGPVLLMIHQSPTSSMDYSATFDGFVAAGLRIIAMDTPGMGLSDAPAAEPTIADFAAAAPAVLDHAGVRQADVIGHHTGAQIAVEAAARYPDRFRKIVLYGVPVMTPEEMKGYWDRIVPHEKQGAVHHPKDDGSHLVDQFTRFVRFADAVTAQRMLISALNAGPTWWYGHNAALTHDMVPALKAAPHPVLLLSNTDEMLDSNTRAAQAVRPDAEFVMLDKACAIAMDGDPQGFVDAVVRFLRA